MRMSRECFFSALFAKAKALSKKIRSCVGVTQLHMTEERPAEGILCRLFYSIKKTKTADDLLHFLQSRVKNAVIIAKRIGVCYMYRDMLKTMSTTNLSFKARVRFSGALIIRQR